jgi:hypothetical protein
MRAFRLDVDGRSDHALAIERKRADAMAGVQNQIML